MGTQSTLEKLWSPVPVPTYGHVKIRAVVLARKKTDASAPAPAPAHDEEDPVIESGDGPLDAYLERPRHGKHCIVFLINGQRHHAWDNTFIARELGFKHIRVRTIIMVDLDGLKPEAVADIINGSRQGFYEGGVYASIRERVIATLKDDPDLKKEEAKAEQEIADAATGDESIQKKLDELIEEHHPAGDHQAEGATPTDAPAAENGMFGRKLVRQDVVLDGTRGTTAIGPTLTIEPNVSVLRLRPDAPRTVVIRSSPPEEWANKIEVAVARQTDPALQVALEHAPDHLRLTLTFVEPKDFDEDEYPVRTKLKVFARFKSYDEVRALERDVIINPPPEPPPPRPPPVLSKSPSFLRVTSRVPVKLVPGGPSTHVRLRWDGEDSLLIGSPAPWQFVARCTSTSHTFPPITLGIVGGGKLELLLDTPAELAPLSMLDFEVEARGPAHELLRATFQGQVPPPEEKEEKEVEAKKVKAFAPQLVQRKPNYQIVIVKKKTYDLSTCWEGKSWTDHEAGYFTEPTATAPLTLYLNEDYAPLEAYRAKMMDKKLDAKTVAERLAAYKSLVLFHLYQMHKAKKRRESEAQQDPDSVKVPEDIDFREEVNRVASTIVLASK